ncbi:MAG: TylF/MycF family methyltransferase [Chromatiaceae bacterium]|nr:TylF/MycF family methyltransferase [Chromatiaceae bacterium]
MKIVKGNVAETIPTLDTKQISLLRLDTDTYERTQTELELLYDFVPRGAWLSLTTGALTRAARRPFASLPRGVKYFRCARTAMVVRG